MLLEAVSPSMASFCFIGAWARQTPRPIPLGKTCIEPGHTPHRHKGCGLIAIGSSAMSAIFNLPTWWSVKASDESESSLSSDDLRRNRGLCQLWCVPLCYIAIYDIFSFAFSRLLVPLSHPLSPSSTTQLISFALQLFSFSKPFAYSLLVFSACHTFLNRHESFQSHSHSTHSHIAWIPKHLPFLVLAAAAAAAARVPLPFIDPFLLHQHLFLYLGLCLLRQFLFLENAEPC